jgi:hypothetical protein
VQALLQAADAETDQTENRVVSMAFDGAQTAKTTP